MASSSSSSSSTRISLFCCLFLSLTTIVIAGGKRDYGEECSITGQIGNIFRSDANDDKDACNTDKGLLCVIGKCSCTPGHVYEKTGLLSFINGGKCVIAANIPCTGRDSTCVSYATCGDSLSVCRCVEGYHAKDGYCTNGGAQILLNSLYVVGLLASYFMLA